MCVQVYFLSEVNYHSPPLSSRAQPMDLQFSQPAFGVEVNHHSPPLSSRAQPRDLRFSQPAFGVDLNHYSPLCHPERSRGICGSLNPHLALI